MSLQDRLRQTLATFDTADALLEGNGSPKEFLVDLYHVSQAQRLIKQWGREQEAHYAEAMATINDAIDDNVRAATHANAAIDRYNQKTRDLQLPLMELSRETLVGVSKDDAFDERLRHHIEKLLEHDKQVYNVQEVLWIDPLDSGIPQLVAEGADLLLLFKYEFTERLLWRLRVELAKLMQKGVKKNHESWKLRDQKLLEFVAGHLMPMVREVKRVQQDENITFDGDVEMSEA